MAKEVELEEVLDLLKRKQTMKQALNALSGFELREVKPDPSFAVRDARKEFAVVQYDPNGTGNSTPGIFVYGSGKFYSFYKNLRLRK